MDETGIEQVWKVGELATKSGLTVRTLHHYDRIGLVCPAGRTSSGHRLYFEADVQRLYQVLALRQLGLGLDQIAQVLTGAVAMAQVLVAHRDYLAAQVAATQDLHALVATLVTTAENRPEVSADHFLALIRRTVMVDDTAKQYFTRDNAEAFTTLYFAQLAAQQRALELWYAEDARLTVGDTPYVGTTAIFEQLLRLPQAGYNVNAIDVQADTDVSALLRVTGNLMRDGVLDARPFETSFTLNRSSADDAYTIASQNFQVV
ncbi:MerR family transcriptional regulator [Nocardia salmonicida]|uniref:MerR family transcriptional regulator n=1 Tax=Nocardia salmonicida TaxID=53431 RepID=UPI0009FCCA58|nr:MerR family transcriptional regulator [Nocardia salmonicida]